MRHWNIRLEKLQDVSAWKKVLIPIIFVLLGILFSSVFILVNDLNPIAVFRKMISYSFLNETGLTSSINAALPLMLCGLGVSISFRMNLNNIGAEGQFAMGAILGGWFALYGPS